VIFPSIFSALHVEDAALWTKSSTAIPSVISQVLSPFQQVLVVQAIYPDKLINTLTQFLSRTLGKLELTTPEKTNQLSSCFWLFRID
jgi:dynein heavy chain 2